MPVLAQSGFSPFEIEVCGASPSLVCRKVLQWTGSDAWANLAEFVVGRPLRVLVVLLVAWGLSSVARRGINRAVARAKDPSSGGRLARAGLTGRLRATSASARASQRIDAIGAIVRSGVSTAIWAIASVTVLGDLGVSLGPLLASAGIAGIALGFGAQNLVKDFLSGMFMLVEDQYGVGDVVDLGEAKGVVEGLSLRSTRVRDVEGTLWHVPNGEIRRVGNKSQGWARAVVDIGLSYSTDIPAAIAVMQEVADAMTLEEPWSSSVIDKPEILGVEELGQRGVAVRMVVKTKPGDQWKVKRELLGRLKSRFEAEGIDMPAAQVAQWWKAGQDTPPAGERG